MISSHEGIGQKCQVLGWEVDAKLMKWRKRSQTYHRAIDFIAARFSLVVIKDALLKFGINFLLYARSRYPRFTSNNCAGLFDISLGNIYDDYSANAIYCFLAVVDTVIHNHVQNVRAVWIHVCVNAVGLSDYISISRKRYD